MTAKRPVFLTLPVSSKVPKTAMVMAAGLGKRMRPLTATKPKPLVAVAGKPLIDHALSRLAAAGVERAVVNVHYLADAMEAHLKRNHHGMDIVISDERGALLETGGGLAVRIFYVCPSQERIDSVVNEIRSSEVSQHYRFAVRGSLIPTPLLISASWAGHPHPA